MITTLNLVNPEKSVIRYKISKFPDGQQTLDITSIPFDTESVEIKSRLNNFKDLEIIICATHALRNYQIQHIELYVPFISGSRSDRKFQDGGVNYLKQVMGPILNSLGFSKITTIDPHSDVLEACLNNYEKISNFGLVKFALTKIDNKNGAQDRITLISPDAGAYKKIFDVAKEFKIPNIVTANKVRDVITGNIVKTEVPVTVYDAGKTFVIIDDICDGGRTFIEIAKAIRSITNLSSVSNQPTKIYLVVTHGIFSKGFYELAQYIDGIFSTNSYSDIPFDKVEEFSDYTVKGDFLKQYNVY
jgi:ribose-phosphate pyrophosphokinase